MVILPSDTSPPIPAHLAQVEAAWRSHPLRIPVVDAMLEDVTLVVEAAERFGLDPSAYPRFTLRIAPDNHYYETPLTAALAHELTHVIDRHDPLFLDSLSPLEAYTAIGALPEGNANESIRRAFHAYWNAYIDGRLARRGITVDTLDNRMAEKLGIRGSVGPVTEEEKLSLEHIWKTEPHTLRELIGLAEKHPYRRPAKYWVQYPNGGA